MKLLILDGYLYLLNPISMNLSLIKIKVPCLFLLLGILNSCGNGSTSKKEFSWKNEILNNPYKIEYTDPKGRDFTSEIDSIIQNLVYQFDDNSPGSFSNEFNSESNSEITNDHVNYLIRKSIEMNRSTGGAFDITFLPLLIHSQKYSVNQLIADSASTLDSIKDFVNSDLLHFESRSSSAGGDSKSLTYLEKEDSRVRIMLGGIYKGYLVDQVAEFLENKKVKHYYVEFGSNPHVKCSGEMNHEWSVVIKSPSKDETVSHKKGKLLINLGSKGLACSGTDIEAILKDGKLITKYIDPRTGKLVRNNLLNAIVVAPETTTADALATAFMIMGKKGAIDYLRQHAEIEAVLIYSDETGNIQSYFTDGLRSKVREI